MSPFDPEVAEAVEAWGKDDVAWKGAWPLQGTQSKGLSDLTGRTFQTLLFQSNEHSHHSST